MAKTFKRASDKAKKAYRQINRDRIERIRSRFDELENEDTEELESEDTEDES